MGRFANSPVRATTGSRLGRPISSVLGKWQLTLAKGNRVFRTDSRWLPKQALRVLAEHGLVAMRAAQAIARSPSKLQDAARIEILDGEGKVLFESDLPPVTL